MILKKPYALFIKLFKPLHLVLAILIAYLIYITSKVLEFLSSYIYSNSNVVGELIKGKLINSYMYLIPLILIVFSLVVLGIMFNKKKPYLLYLITIFVFIFIIVINFYASDTLETMERAILSIKSIKLIHDLILLNIIAETVLFVSFIARGMGFDLKRFNFASEVSKLDISEADKEEFELGINIDIFEIKRKRKRNFRYLKYKYLEKKFVINLIVFILVLSVFFGIYVFKSILISYDKEGAVYSLDGINIGVDETRILNKDVRGNTITKSNLIVIKVKLKSTYSKNQLYLKDFKLHIGEATFSSTNEYNDLLIDLGSVYNEKELSSKLTNYLLVYEIPNKYKNSEMFLYYSGISKKLNIKLNPQEISYKGIIDTKKMTETLDFKHVLGDVSIKINNYDIKDEYLIEYNYCVKKDDCLLSKEYLKPSIDQNFDKYILRLSINYKNNSTLKFDDFYNFFKEFGSIEYEINGNNYYQNVAFEEIKSSRKKITEDVYIGINSDIINATSIKLVFSIYGSRYEYVLK